MTVTDIKPVDWWCAAHERAKQMTWKDKRWVMVCIECEAKAKTEGEKRNG